jgi:hypothetical protein
MDSRHLPRKDGLGTEVFGEIAENHLQSSPFLELMFSDRLDILYITLHPPLTQSYPSASAVASFIIIAAAYVA